MGRFCGNGSRRFRSGGGGTRVAGIVLMVVGLLLFLIFVPKWVWTSALGIVCISVGFLLWRFGG